METDFPSDWWFGWMGPAIPHIFGTYDKTEIAEKYVFRPWEPYSHTELWQWHLREGGLTDICWVTGGEVQVWYR